MNFIESPIKLGLYACLMAANRNRRRTIKIARMKPEGRGEREKNHIELKHHSDDQMESHFNKRKGRVVKDVSKGHGTVPSDLVQPGIKLSL